MQPALLHEVLRDRARQRPDRVVLRFDERALTFGELDREVDAFAARLGLLGVERGGFVALLLPNVPEMAIALLACARLGAVVVPVNVALKGEGLAYVFEQSGARFAVADAALVERLAAALAGRVELDLLVLVRAESAPGVSGPFRRIEPFASSSPAPMSPLPPVAAADPWAILYTSGTTGPAKGVVLPHQMWATESEEAARGQGLDESSVLYSFLPLFHLNSLCFALGSAIVAGCQAVLRERFPQERFLEDLRANGVTHAAIPAFVLMRLLESPPDPAERGLRLRFALSMGVPPDAWPRLEARFGCRVACGYGLTETGMLCVLATDRPGASGRANPRYELAVVDDDDQVLAPGAIGQVVCRARRPNEVMLGYHRMPEATAAAFRNGWFHTGDLGWFDADGYFHFADRRKDMIKRRGENVSATEVEAQLARHPAVADVAVASHAAPPDEEVRAFVVVAPGQTLDPAALLVWLGERVAYFMVPRYVDVVTELPRNALGKVEKYKLRALPVGAETFDRVSAGVKVDR